ncbi:glycosyltransferase [Tistrella arctica]
MPDTEQPRPAVTPPDLPVLLRDGRPLRVMQLMAGAAHGGAEAFFDRLAVAFHHRGIEQAIAVRPHPERMAKLRAAGLDPQGLRFGRHVDIRTWWRLRRMVKRFRPDIVLTWMNRATAACPAGDFVHVARLGGYYDLKNYRGADHLVGNTRDIVAYLRRKGVPAERSHYVPNFVDATPMPPEPRSRWGTPDDAPLILGLGRLHPNKGFDVLIRAVAQVPRAHLWLAGVGSLEDDLRELARGLGITDRVSFLGWRTDVAALYAAADVFVCSSRHEPLGNIVLEAWAHGVPVVAAASQGPSELIAHGANGLLVPVDHDAAMAASIETVLRETRLRETMIAGGRTAYERNFTEAAVVGAYADLFRRILPRS